MTDPDDDIVVPQQLADSVNRYVAEQEHRRGDWPSPRLASQPEPPWPDRDNAMLRYLLHTAELRLQAGQDARDVLLQAVVHAWFEGGIEAWDACERDHRSDRSW